MGKASSIGLGRRFLVLLAIVGIAAISVEVHGTQPYSAESQAPLAPVSIYPADRAEFLPGTLFDLVVELGTPGIPGDLTVLVNGIPASEFFEKKPERLLRAVAPHALVWRGLTSPAPGRYRIEVKTAAVAAQVEWNVRPPRAGKARNVILFIADGMTVAQLSAARLISRGIESGKYNRPLAIDGMEQIGLVHTAGLDSIIADSANTASAMNTGHKTREGATGVYMDRTPNPLDEPRVETFGELIARTRKMSVGIVTTADFTDATPAAVFGHCRDRQLNCRTKFARTPLDGGLAPDVILGGGAQWLLAQREDQGEMVREYLQAGYAVTNTATRLSETLQKKPKRLLGLFHLSHLNVWLDRNVYKKNLGSFPDQPGLREMTLAALSVLGEKPNGFYLMVEAASVDKQMHAMDQERALADLIEFDEAVGVALDWVEKHAPQTLVVVTADHGQSYDVYGTVDVKKFNAAKEDSGKRSAIQIYGKAGRPDYVDADADGYPDRWDVDFTLAGISNNHPDYIEDFQVKESPPAPGQKSLAHLLGAATASEGGLMMPSNLPPPVVPGAGSAVHTLTDVPIFASGPGAENFGRVMDNTEVFFGMAAAIGLDPTRIGKSGAGPHVADLPPTE